jgi:hypothetical protein
MRAVSVGDVVSFRVDGDGERLSGLVVAVNLSTVDGISTADWDEPAHAVSVDTGGMWAIHPSWMVDDLCEVCGDEERACMCWRCMECETLFADHVDAMESDTGEMVCLGCF